MRIFSDEADKTPEIKYWLSRHKALMSARELSSYRNVYPLHDGRKVLITSIEGIDNITISKQEKKPLSEFQLPRELQNQALIWAGATRFPASIFNNLSRLWGSRVRLETTLPLDLLNYKLVFIPALSRSLTVDELTRLAEWKTATNGKLVMCLGATSIPSLLNLSAMDETDEAAMTYGNSLLTGVGSPLRFAILWHTLSAYLTYATGATASYNSKVLSSSYSGFTTSARFNNSAMERFIVNGGGFVVSCDDSSLVEAAITVDEYTETINIPIVHNEISYVWNLYKFGIPPDITTYDYEDYEPWMRYGCALDLDPEVWFRLVGSYDEPRNLSPLQAYYSRYVTTGYRWSCSPVGAYYNNVLVMATGNSWFEDSLVLNSYYSNAEFILSLLFSTWAPEQDYFRSGPYSLSCVVDPGGGLFESVFQI